jgi:hypothetical protein
VGVGEIQVDGRRLEEDLPDGGQADALLHGGRGEDVAEHMRGDVLGVGPARRETFFSLFFRLPARGSPEL